MQAKRDERKKKLKNKNIRKYLIKKYYLEMRKVKEELETIKQQIIAITRRSADMKLKLHI